MAKGVKLLHLVSDNNLVTVVHRFVVPASKVAATKVYQSLVVLFVLGKWFFCLPQLPDQSVEFKMSCPALSVSPNSLKH